MDPKGKAPAPTPPYRQDAQKGYLPSVPFPHAGPEPSGHAPWSILKGNSLDLHSNYPSVDTDASLREELLALRPLGSTPTTDQVQELITAVDEVRSKMSPGSMSQQEELI